MAIRTKGRAKFDFGGRAFVWYIEGGKYVRIASADKRFSVSYSWAFPTAVKVSGPEFAGLPVGRGRPAYLVPPMCGPMPVGRLVNEILVWSFDEKRPLVRAEPAASGW